MLDDGLPGTPADSHRDRASPERTRRRGCLLVAAEVETTARRRKHQSRGRSPAARALLKHEDGRERTKLTSEMDEGQASRGTLPACRWRLSLIDQGRREL
jgi:hypothetical protein